MNEKNFRKYSWTYFFYAISLCNFFDSVDKYGFVSFSSISFLVFAIISIVLSWKYGNRVEEVLKKVDKGELK